MGMSPEMLALVKGAKNKFSRSQGKAKKIKEGKTKIRLLQKPGELKFWRELGVHWIKTTKNGKPVAVVGCHDETYDKPCAVCTAVDKAHDAAVDDEALGIYKEWKTKKSVLVPGLIREGADASSDPDFIEMTPTTFGQFLSITEQWGSDVDAFSPTDGIDFIVERRGKGLDTEYTVMPAPKSSPVPQDVMDKLADMDIDAFIEKEYFANGDTKALTAITATSGVTVKAIGSGRSGSPAALVAPGAAVEETIEAEALAEIENAKAYEKAEAPSTDEPPFEPDPPTEAEQKEAKPATEVVKAAPPAEAKSAPAAEAKLAGDEFGAPLADSEVEDLLKELDDL